MAENQTVNSLQLFELGSIYNKEIHRDLESIDILQEPDTFNRVCLPGKSESPFGLLFENEDTYSLYNDRHWKTISFLVRMIKENEERN